MFNVHVEILNHWEGFLSRINNQLTEQTKLGIMLKCVCHTEAGTFGGRGCVEPCISWTLSIYSSLLVITYSRSLSFQTLRSPDLAWVCLSISINLPPYIIMHIRHTVNICGINEEYKCSDACLMCQCYSVSFLFWQCQLSCFENKIQGESLWKSNLKFSV